jgi:hypothetical protein
MITDRYVAELTALAKSGKPLSEALEVFTQILDAYMIEMPGSFVAKRKALLEAFREKAPDAPLTWPIIDKARRPGRRSQEMSDFRGRRGDMRSQSRDPAVRIHQCQTVKELGQSAAGRSA